MKLLPTTLAFLVLLLASSYLQAAMAGSVFCDTKCKARCAKASVHDRCLFNCGVCCKACNCVPSGTYGNKDECPCYRDKVTSGSGKRIKKPKCP
ncbi:hypothetical protein Taro_031509 [Colocasia esculenta]|uniref:Snakin-1 n=1 Tax=Colocasia esculenta TaxID=4460 RepID=A0A843W3C0_COLES|nr:hypothetical protein [Colocasia esculenta]